MVIIVVQHSRHKELFTFFKKKKKKLFLEIWKLCLNKLSESFLFFLNLICLFVLQMTIQQYILFSEDIGDDERFGWNAEDKWFRTNNLLDSCLDSRFFSFSSSNVLPLRARRQLPPNPAGCCKRNRILFFKWYTSSSEKKRYWIP